MNLGDLGKLLDRYGISLNDTKGVRVVPERRGDMTSPLFLEVKRYLRDDDGERFGVRWPGSNRWSVAYERIRIKIAELDAQGPGVVHDPEITYQTDEGTTEAGHESEVIERYRRTPADERLRIAFEGERVAS